MYDLYELVLALVYLLYVIYVAIKYYITRLLYDYVNVIITIICAVHANMYCRYSSIIYYMHYTLYT